MYSYDQIKTAIVRVSGRWFTNDYDVNLFGIRRSVNSDSFDDILGCIWHYKNRPNIILAPGTTDPGFSARKDPSNKNGVAVLKEGHYKSVFQLDLEGGRRGYAHLNQIAPVTVYRDNNKDTTLDLTNSPTETGLFGIEFHQENHGKDSSAENTGNEITKKSLQDSTVVGRWSEGCQVVSSTVLYPAFIRAFKAQAVFYEGKPWADKFSYTLLLESDIL